MRLLFFLLLATIVVASSKFEDAYELYKNGHFKQSIQIFKKLSQNENDLDAAYILGYMYDNGEGCEVDKQLARQWYKKSARGYYFRTKNMPSREINKEYQKLYKEIEKPSSSQTQATIKQYTESLYNIKAYKANYFLPVSYRYEGLYADTNGHKAKEIETEFQVSIKFDYASDILGFNEIYSVGYTQKSYWQFYTQSAYFRETNYNPEFFITLPFTKKDISYIKAFRVSLEHQSNGRGGEEERSWN